jgi:hypothetical protein
MFHDHCLWLDLHAGFSEIIAHNSHSLSDINEEFRVVEKKLFSVHNKWLDKSYISISICVPTGYIYHKRVLNFSCLPIISLLLSFCAILKHLTKICQDIVWFNNATVLLKRFFRIYNPKLQWTNITEEPVCINNTFTDIKPT